MSGPASIVVDVVTRVGARLDTDGRKVLRSAVEAAYDLGRAEAAETEARRCASVLREIRPLVEDGQTFEAIDIIDAALAEEGDDHE